MKVSNDMLMPQVLSMIAEGHTVTITARGNSMRPYLVSDRDKIILGHLGERVSVGDAVLALLPTGMYVMHRIIAVDGDAVTLLGDGNLTPEHCHLSDIKARAVAFIRKGRTKPETIFSKKYRTYRWLWMRLRPLRRYLLFIFRMF